jgi:hypothetical protein
VVSNADQSTHELSVVEDGKVVWNEAFFDTLAFPKEMQEEMKEGS